MFLEYGVSEDGELQYIGQVKRGLTDLKCPYCGGQLVAKKGQVKVPHFAHREETCRAAQRNQDAIALPAYDNFNLHLLPKALKLLHDFHKEDRVDHNNPYLESLDLIFFNEWPKPSGKWALTKKGKIPFGELSLMLFNEFQEPLIAARADHLENVAHEAYEKRQLEGEYADLDQKYQALQEAKRQWEAEGVYVYDDPRYHEAGRAWEPYNDRYWKLLRLPFTDGLNSHRD